MDQTSIMQRASVAVARHLHRRFNITMVTYLDDWLFFADNHLPVTAILVELQDLGFTSNKEKSITQPTPDIAYLGLRINSVGGTIQPTP
ncbi:hypothetical protein B7P43_G14932 [Cryptotermes secundus]|uniref:Reverse transcriptase domain-containing protein n=1 Tax=Cryptotermes secundus TaxID=105785 RepID=A0A2J7QK91_9NEOP|nr:hypothetical protein B7P43_G14932 [Cryptotermes secundus]